MAAKNESDESASSGEEPGSGVYLDSSALAKLYVPEPESDSLDAFLRERRDLMISELSITEVISAVARRRREGVLDSEKANEIRNTLLSDAKSFLRLDLSPAVHREAETLLLSAEKIPLRTLDALHIALARLIGASRIVTFDVRMAEAARLHGLGVVQLDSQPS